MSSIHNENQNISKIEIHLDEKIMQGVFANVTNIGHTKEEFIIDYLFIQQNPAPYGKLVSRIISTPAHAKRILMALQDNIAKYEAQFGIIDVFHKDGNSDHQIIQ